MQASGSKARPKKVKLPEVYEATIEFKKVKMSAIKDWAVERLTKLMGYEDEVHA